MLHQLSAGPPFSIIKRKLKVSIPLKYEIRLNLMERLGKNLMVIATMNLGVKILKKNSSNCANLLN